jgi:hypothetical protein
MKSIARAIFVVTLAPLLTLAPGTSQAADGPFAAFAGSWSGAGTIEVRDGSRERIRCRGGNTESGNSLKLGLKCASDSYRFELTGDIAYDGGNISGSWGETTRGVYGSLSGRMSRGSIQATAHSAGVNASLSITSSGGRQNVSIRSPGSEVSEVSISMGRGGR